VLALAAALSIGCIACGAAFSRDIANASLALATLALAARCGWSCLSGRGDDAVTGFEWDADGRWRLRCRDGTRRCVRLLHSTTVCGPFMLLVWRGESWRRSYVLLDAATLDPYTWRVLRGRLRLEAGRSHRAADNNC